MVRVFAEFRHQRLESCDIVKCRHDTRIFLGDQQPNTPKTGQCVGAFYLQNPGSAEPTTVARKSKDGLCRWPWGPTKPDPLMKSLIELLEKTLRKIERKDPRRAAQLQKNGYVQLLNLSYVCNAPKAKLASEQWQEIIEARKCTDDRLPDSSRLSFIVFGWGKGRYSDSRDGQRVARALSGVCQSRAYLVFPTAIGERRSATRGVIVSTIQVGGDPESLRSQLKRDSVYPRGANDERTEFSKLYIDALTPKLAGLLTTA